MKIYHGGSDKDDFLISVTGNTAPVSVTSWRKQMFIYFTTDGTGVGKGFSANITYGTYKGKFLNSKSFLLILFMTLILLLIDNLCKKALNLNNEILIVESHFPYGTYCQWIISAVDDKHYVNLEFENIDVRIAEFNNSPHTFPGRVQVNFRWGGPKNIKKIYVFCQNSKILPYHKNNRPIRY